MFMYCDLWPKEFKNEYCSQLYGKPKIALGKYFSNAIFGYFYFITAIWLMRFWLFLAQKSQK